MEHQSMLQEEAQNQAPQENRRLLEELPNPSIISKDDNTINEPFGSLNHFRNFWLQRTGSAFRLDTKLTSSPPYYEDTKRLERLRKKVFDCIEEAGKAKAETDHQEAEYMSQALKIKQILKEKSSSLDEFLSAIVKIYTTEYFPGYWLNELLRKESWLQINVLTPLLVCLMHTFKLSEFEVTCQDSQSSTLSLYRGASLTQKQIDLYNPRKVDLFSWNAFTSTSRSLKVAERFVGFSLIKNPEKIGVLFKIHVPFGSRKDREGMIDVSKQSKFPKEEEVILAPGTVFKLLRVRVNQNGIYEITLRVVKEFEENAKVLARLYKQVLQGHKAIIDDRFSLQEVFTVLRLLKGNRSIKKLEIWNLDVDEDLLEEIESVRVTTKLKKQNVKFVGNSIVVRSEEYLRNYLAPERMKRFKEKNTVYLSNRILV